MKKLYAFAATAVAAIAMSATASAQLYLVGSAEYNGTPLAWTPEAPAVVELVDGAYTFDLVNLAGIKMSTVSGEGAANAWDAFNGGAIWAKVTEDLLGTPVALEQNGEPNFTGPWPGDYHVVVAGDFSTVTLTTTTPKPEGFTKVYVRGEVSSWGDDIDPMWQMSTEDGVTYTFKAEGATTIPAGKWFKLADLTWEAVNYSYGMEADTVLDAYDEELEWFWNCKNTAVDADFVGTITMVTPEEGADKIAMVTFTKGGDGIEGIKIDNNAAVEYFNLQGVRVANPENGLFIARQGSKVVKVVK